MNKHKTRISQILGYLLAERKMRVTELARRVNLPQPTIHRIVSSMCEHPHLSSLQPIAEFFSITVDQLRGFDPIPWLEQITKVPLLTWDQVREWPDNKNSLINNRLVITDALCGHSAYAVILNDTAMDPIFPRGIQLIADPDRPIKDRSYVIVKRKTHDYPIFRQLLIDAQDQYLKPLSPDLNQYALSKIDDNDKILSVVLQAKRDCES